MPAVNGNPVINVAVPVPQPVSPPPTPDRRPTPVSPRKPARPTRAKDNDPDEALVQQQQAAAAQQQQVLAQPALRAVIMPWTPDDAVATSPAPKPAKMTPFRRQGQPARYAVPRSWYNGRRGLSHKQLSKWLGNDKSAQTPGAMSQWLGPMVFTPHEEGILASTGGQPLAVVRPDGSYRIETDASSGFHRQDPTGMKFALNALTGAGFNIKRGKLFLGKDPLTKGMEVRPPSRELADWWNKVVDTNQRVDHNAALPLADLLEERGDWRHHILKRMADPNTTRTWHARPDGLTHETPPGENHYPPGSTYEQANDWARQRHFPANGWVRYGRDPRTGNPTILTRVGFNLRGEPKSNKIGFAIFTPEEYHAMREDAGKAGHPIPEPPESHRPQPTQMSRLPKRVIRFAMPKGKGKPRRDPDANAQRDIVEGEIPGTMLTAPSRYISHLIHQGYDDYEVWHSRRGYRAYDWNGDAVSDFFPSAEELHQELVANSDVFRGSTLRQVDPPR